MPQQATRPTYVIFGPRVSEASKQAIREEMHAEEIPADFGPFGSGAYFCELFPFLKHEREGKSQQELDARREANLATLKNAHVVFIESTGEQPDVSDSVERVRFMVRSLKRYGVGEVTLAMPSTAYERQDRGFAEQGRLCSEGLLWWVQDLKRYGVDRIINFAPHSQAGIEFWRDEFGKANYYPLQTTELFAEHIRNQFSDLGSLLAQRLGKAATLDNLVIGAPDGADKPNDQGQARARELAVAVHGRKVTDADLFKIGKAHTDASETKVTSFAGNVVGKDCVIIDDMSDGGSTLINAAKTLKEQGARSVSVYFTHAICSNNSLHKLASNANIDRVMTTDTVPEIIAKREALASELQGKVEILAVGQQLARTLNDIGTNKSFASRADTGRGATKQVGA